MVAHRGFHSITQRLQKRVYGARRQNEATTAGAFDMRVHGGELNPKRRLLLRGPQKLEGGERLH